MGQSKVKQEPPLGPRKQMLEISNVWAHLESNEASFMTERRAEESTTQV